jgi:two-component system, chemotaxis family, sensor kinase CheA
MNELVTQFILESRDLVEQATAGLAALEHSPQDEQWIDATFRAIHTLKGGAAIVDFAAMERLVHAAEDALGEARAGKRSLDKAMIGACLACLDQVLRWLDVMEQSGEIPSHAATQVEALLTRLSPSSEDTRRRSQAPSWLDKLLERHQQVRSHAKSAVRFTPHSANFFQGEDPIGLFASIPGLLAFELEPIAEWPSLDTFDPFESLLILSALTASSPFEVRAHFEEHLGDCEIISLSADEQDDALGTLPQAVASVLRAQLELLANVPASGFAGRVSSAGVLAANVLRSCGQTQAGDLIAAATAQSLDAKNPQPLRECIATAMTGTNDAAIAVAAPVAAADQARRPEYSVRTLRVDAERIDALVRLTGELTVVKNAIGHAVNVGGEQASVAESLRGHQATLDHLVGELQRAVLAVRVLPLRTVLQRIPRLVRETSESLKKQVNLIIEGDETEADKTIVEMLFEPLLHIVRNAIDHGIEEVAVRLQRNKPAMASLRIRASRQGGHVHIEISDDGAGIDPDRVRQKARERELVETERLDAMTEAEVIELVFAPGFSTASEVTGLSGRGVGMDAVRSAVERVGGRVSLESRKGQGTLVRLTLPFSVMMTQVLTTEAGGQMFGIPLESVVETLSVPTETIESIGAAKAIVRRDRTIPIFDLTHLLRVPVTQVEHGEATIVVTSIAGHLNGIRVDRLGERMEVMLKPLEGLLASLSGITGTTILGDGRVLLVLDLTEVLQ